MYHDLQNSSGALLRVFSFLGPIFFGANNFGINVLTVC